MDRRQEVARGFVVAGGDGAELLEFSEEVFDQVAGLVEFPVMRPRILAVAAGRNDEGLAGLFQRADNAFVGVVSFVGNHSVGLNRGKQEIGSVQIVSLAGRQSEAGRIAQGIHGRVNFAAQAAPAAPQGLLFALFFRAPALC